MNDFEQEYVKCKKCHKSFKTYDLEICPSCEKLKKEGEDNFKWFNPFSFKGASYLGIAGVIIYILYNNISISYTGLIILGGLALFAFMYFEDNYKKK